MCVCVTWVTLICEITIKELGLLKCTKIPEIPLIIVWTVF